MTIIILFDINQFMDSICKIIRKWLKECKENEIPELYLVGGPVRDILIQRHPKDIDFVCKNARPFASLVAKKKKAAMVCMEKKKDEPCYRLVNKRNPLDFLDIAEMRGNNIQEDLKRRDFTINAMAMRVNKTGFESKIIDVMNGQKDLQSKLIKMVSESAFTSDPLRMLRAVRFAAQLDYSIDKSTQSRIKEQSHLIKNVSAERIFNELLIILHNKKSCSYFKMLDDLKILEIIFPEISPMKGCSQNYYHHKDVWGHSLLVMEHTDFIVNNLNKYFGNISKNIYDYLEKQDRSALLKLSALLHDMGKPQVWEKKENGRITFHKHEQKGSFMMEELCKRLRISKNNTKFLCLMVSEHMHVLYLSMGGVKGSTIRKWIRKHGDHIIGLNILGMADRMSTAGPGSSQDDREKSINWSKSLLIDYFTKTKKIIERKNLISGRDLINMNIEPGPFLGTILNKVRDAQDAGLIKNKEEALTFALEIINRNKEILQNK